MADAKPWYKSKTVWFNVVTLGLGILDLLSSTQFVNPEYIAFAAGIGNVILRVWFTDAPIR